MPVKVFYWLVLVSICGAVNILFYSFGNSVVRLPDLVKHASVIQSEFDTSKMKVTLFPSAYQTGLLPTVRSTASYKHPVRRLKNIDRTQDTLNNRAQDRVFKFKINNYTACTRTSSDLVIIVISRVDNFLRRQAIRNTWASVAKDFNASVYFLVGTSMTSSIQPQVEIEAILYNDVIQVDISDSYNYLTYKTMAMLQWLNDYCYEANYFLKTDDDMYINIANMFKSISSNKKDPNKRFFLCHVFVDAPPIRDVSSKWYTSYEEFKRMFFSDILFWYRLSIYVINSQ